MKRWCSTALAACILGLLSAAQALSGAAHPSSLEPATLMAWKAYTEAARAKAEQRISSEKPFLWADESPERLRRIRAGQVVVASASRQNPVNVESGLIHDWIGAVFIAETTLQDVLTIVRDYARYSAFYRPTVVASLALSQAGSTDRFWLLLNSRTLFVSTAISADYEVHYVKPAALQPRGMYSVAVTTRVQEIENYGLPAQRTLPEGTGNGLIWKMYGITRYLERDGGVYMEFETIVLSRKIPAALQPIVDPIVRRVARSSLVTTMTQTRVAVLQHARTEVTKSSSEEVIHD